METIPTTTIKTLEVESKTPTIIAQQPKHFSFSNGLLKRHHPFHHHHHAVVVTYKECLKNHAASTGGHAIDGCGEFMPSSNINPSDPTSLKCAACGCHRSFHRRELEEPPFPPPSTTQVLEYQPQHRHHPPPSPLDTNTGSHSCPSSHSPPPISTSYYNPSAPHVLLSLTSSGTGDGNQHSRKRFRTKFSQSQKEKMLEFAERIEWMIQKRDEKAINEFCDEIGVEKGVFKVWMHNNKNTLGKKDMSSNIATATEGDGSGGATAREDCYNYHHGNVVAATTNGSNGLEYSS